ncbi:MAG: polyribonucleotide nucleotidyltransferase [candidate division KSB1 bacterium]|nr:polyribonucleotide nucleotidyltransferase [candidate division KSB1 bacterium]
MVIKKEIDFAGKTLSVETGKMAKQASAAVWIRYGDTVLLATVVGSDSPREGIDFFPLQVEYRERTYAAGKIPGGYIKREGRPSETEILSARLIDRPIRPLFPKGYNNEVQVMVHVLSSDKENDADVLAITAVGIAVNLSEIPFEGPIAGARVGRVDGEWVVNPTYSQREESDVDLVMAASEESILMVEGEAMVLSEEDMIKGMEFGHEKIKELIELEKELVQEAGKVKLDVPEEEDNTEFLEKVQSFCNDNDRLKNALNLTDKQSRQQAIKALRDEIAEELEEEFPESEKEIRNIIHDMEKEIVRAMILNESRRLDGRSLDDIRDISIEVGLLPRAHGSALFTRGQTQSLTAATLGTKIDEQRIEGLEGDFSKNYMLHYNFPPFCTGEVKMIRGTSRREVGHGNLAERALKPSIPADSLFPYTIRIVSDILESNGSSSMATVCAGSLSLMDAGVPVKSHIAGIAMGLIKEDDKVAVLTDILGDEDHMGDMDFKVAGNREGITAFQMDIKIKGISSEIMAEALDKARNARLFILEKMQAAISGPRTEISEYAPRILSFKIEQDDIGTVIGPGGKMIREIQETTGATINIEEDGTVTIACLDSEGGEQALERIKGLVAKPEPGKIYEGTIKKITNFGAFVEILPGKEGLLHISNVSKERIARVEDVLKVGDKVKVKLMSLEPNGKMDLNRKVLL